ncbi:DMT family transporter [Amycolatopsis pithecellobii]|uniref:EamA-like transporter family protein n=1 Tax=Amycolatopsis pithecellobii TaxID=664692 RepID=A0A6N7YY94_9PSEU|nr:DMT family transporter [Amycolatopsis pithecellobii]MTD52401.1 hypothetical protein [Amycolatopsis pithecellobii]
MNSLNADNRSGTESPALAAPAGVVPQPRKWPAVVAALVVSMLLPLQSWLNGELGHRVGDGTAAAALSLAAGWVAVTPFALLIPRQRRAWRTLATAVKERQFPRYCLLAGACGSVLVFVQSTAALVTGIAVFTVSVIAGQTLGGLVVDALGIARSPRRGLGAARLIGAVLVVAAAVISVFPRLVDAPHPVTVLLPALGAVTAGFMLSLQKAMNGATAAAARSPLLATWVSFFVATAIPLLVWGARHLAGGGSVHLPTQIWLYFGGLVGAVFIAVAALVVRHIGVLLLSMASVAGQLVGSIALDVFFPLGGALSVLPTATGACLTLIAIAIATKGRNSR